MKSERIEILNDFEMYILSNTATIHKQPSSVSFNNNHRSDGNEIEIFQHVCVGYFAQRSLDLNFRNLSSSSCANWIYFDNFDN